MILVACAALFYLSMIAFAIVVYYRSRQRVSRMQKRLRNRDYKSFGAEPASKEREAGPKTRQTRLQRSIDKLRTGRLSRLIRYDPLLSLRIFKYWSILFVVALLFSIVISVIARVILESSSAYLLVFVVWIAFVRAYAGWCESKQRILLFYQFPDALDVLIRSVRVGIPLASAVVYVADNVAEPTASRFKLISERLNIGATIGEALESLLIYSPIPEYRFFAVALKLHSQTGGNIIETFETFADTMRSRAASKGKANALLAEPRMSMSILASLPFVLTFILLLINPSYIMPLFASTSGHHVLLFALGFWTMGLLSMQIMIKKGVP